MGLATEIAHRSKSPLPLGEAAEKIYAQVIEEQPALARKDFSSVYRFMMETSAFEREELCK
jgi:3-hydroxyisobutyrate dehydrogenase